MESNQRLQLIWDLPLRLWHWALVVCLTGSWITAEAGFDWTTTHFYFGYSALALVIFRLGWGLRRHPAFALRLFSVLAASRHWLPI
jgi:cytochrome b